MIEIGNCLMKQISKFREKLARVHEINIASINLITNPYLVVRTKQGIF